MAYSQEAIDLAKKLQEPGMNDGRYGTDEANKLQSDWNAAHPDQQLQIAGEARPDWMARTGAWVDSTHVPPQGSADWKTYGAQILQLNPTAFFANQSPGSASPTPISPSINPINTIQPVSSPTPIDPSSTMLGNPTQSMMDSYNNTSANPLNTIQPVGSPTNIPTNIQSNLPTTTPIVTSNTTSASPYTGPTESLVNNMTSSAANNMTNSTSPTNPTSNSYSTMSQTPNIGGNPMNTNKKLNTFGGVQ